MDEGQLQVADSDGHVIMGPVEFAKYVARVDMICDLVTAMLKALINTPFAAMLPPDLMRELREL